MDIHTLKVVLAQINIVIDKYKINMRHDISDRFVLHGMLAIKNIIKEDIERLENIENGEI